MVRLMYQFQAATCSSMLEALALVVIFICHLKKLVRPEKFGPYSVSRFQRLVIQNITNYMETGPSGGASNFLAS